MKVNAQSKSGIKLLRHAVFFKFKEAATHPSHKAFAALAGPFIEKVVVIDYWIQH